MNAFEVVDLIARGETSTVQFKEQKINKDSLAAELVAMSNSLGGDILFGVRDKDGTIVGLGYQELQEIGNTVATVAKASVLPPVYVSTEVVSISMEDGNEKKILIVHVPEGIAKPYKDCHGAFWIKVAGDKRRITDNNEILRLFQQSGVVYVDELAVPETSEDLIDRTKVATYLAKIDDSSDVTYSRTLFRNLGIMKGDKLTLGGLFFFSFKPQQYRPVFCIKAISFFGNDIGGCSYRGSVDITGTIPEMFNKGMDFFDTYLKHIQQGQNFNSVGKLEVSHIALEEVLQNALVHRDYSKNAPIRIMIFDNRIEIVSPGCLPNHLSVENIKLGNAVVRNNLIVSYASKLMPYRGFGSGIRRAMLEQPNIEFENDRDGEQFLVRIPRPS
jgi:predicted HTH transcriptional regulator